MKENYKKQLSLAIRKLTVPPVIVTLFLLILWKLKPEVFSGKPDLCISIAALGFFPVLAYAVCAVVPSLKKGGRDTQRRLAFVFTFIGYLLAWAYGHLQGVSDKLLLIYDTYFFSVVLLVVLNFIFRIKASGHACSVTGPLALSIYLIGAASILPCIILEAVSCWASLQSKRHTFKQIIIGAAAAVIAFLASLVRYQVAAASLLLF